MREAAGEFGKQSHGFQGLFHALFALFFAQMEAVGIQAFGNDIVHLRALVERGHRVLENHLYAAGDFVIQRAGNAAVDLFAVKGHLAARSGMNADDGAADGGFARAGLPHQAEGFALEDVERNAVHGGEGMAPGAELHGQAFNFQQFFAFSGQAAHSLLSRDAMMRGLSTFGARGSSSQVARLVGGRHLEIRRVAKVNLQRLRVAGRESVALDLVEQVGRRALNGKQRLALTPNCGSDESSAQVYGWRGS